MASIRKYKDGRHAEVYVGGQRRSKTCRTKREAFTWAYQTEEALRHPQSETQTLRQALERWRDEIAPKRNGERWECIRIDAWLRDPEMPCSVQLPETTPEQFGRWRDARLSNVSAGTVLREFSLLSAILETARREWRWLDNNPLRDVRKPRHPDHREVIITRSQTLAMLRTMGYDRQPCRSATQAAARAFLLALHTGMRDGEICALRWDDVHPDYLRVRGEQLGAGKTSAARRDVPLVRSAGRLVASMRGWDADTVFGLKSQTLDALFMRYRDRAGLSGFTFHDVRHTAATRLARKVDVLTLCKIMWWRSTTQALVYFNPRASDIRQQIEPGRRPRSESSR